MVLELQSLLVTSSRGLLEISRTLAQTDGLCVMAEPPIVKGCSQTQLTSKFGFLHVLEWLLDSQQGKISPDIHENSTIRLALRSGNDKVATRVLQALLSDFSMDYDDYDDTDSYSDFSDDSVAPIAAMTLEGAALVEAVQCGSGPAVFDILLRVSDQDARDSSGRTPLIIVAANGSVGLVERLLKSNARVGAKDSDGRNAMHHACVQGHMLVVEVLTNNEYLNLEAQIRSLQTLMTLAIRASHQHTVRLLLPKLTNDALKMEFVLTAANGQDHILEQILKFATN